MNMQDHNTQQFNRFTGTRFTSAVSSSSVKAGTTGTTGNGSGNASFAPLTAVRIDDTFFHRVTMQEAVDRIGDMAQRRDTPRYVCTGNLDHLAIMKSSAAMRAAYEGADLVLADGMPVVWLSKLARMASPEPAVFAPLPERVTGADLFWEMGKLSAERGLKLYFLGGATGSAERAAEALKARYPGVIISGTYCPPFERFGSEAEQANIAEKIRAAAPDILLVAFGAPKQEDWIVKNRFKLGVPVSIGVGGSFEMASGIVRRAPMWAQRSGLEWAFRMTQEPKRLVHRYLGRDLPVLTRIALPMAARVVSTRAAHLSERISVAAGQTALF